MRQKIGLIATILAVVGLLVAINTASYVTQEEDKDSEIYPNRSSYHAGPTGTRALYDLLSESGFSVMRWREDPEKLFSDESYVSTFVVIGNTRIDFTEEQAESLLLWVESGGRLVIVDRNPPFLLLPSSEKWALKPQFHTLPPLDTNPASIEEMTANVREVKPSLPTLLTESVDSVMPSRFASVISFTPTAEPPKVEHQIVPMADDDEDEEPPPPARVESSVESAVESAEGEQPGPVVISATENEKPASPAPVTHLADARGALLVDYPHGAGRIVILTEPYIFSNGGIGLKDNFQLATNILTSGSGLIAFDEFHQGRGVTQNAWLAYFAGTPVLALGGQLLLIVLLLLWTRGRRFGRPLPLARVDRRSTLEFVASMAEVQQRARAFDLAIENVYSRTRRVLARYAGLDYNSPRSVIAQRVASRSNIDARQLEVLMRQCEEAINGEPISERQSIQLVRRLREVESALGLRMRSREVKQAAQQKALTNQ